MPTSVLTAGDRNLAGLLLALTATTGCVDAVSYLALGHVFTANMTGNVVFLGFATAGDPGLSIARPLAALGAFLVGAVAGGRLATAVGHDAAYRWLGAAFAIETALLGGASVAAFAGAGVGAAVYAIIVLTGLAMGLRAATVRQLPAAGMTTTVLTLTLASLAADSSIAGGNNQGWQRRLASVVTVCGGAAVGAWLLHYSVALPLAFGTLLSGVSAATAYCGLRGPSGRAILSAGKV